MSECHWTSLGWRWDERHQSGSTFGPSLWQCVAHGRVKRVHLKAKMLWKTMKLETYGLSYGLSLWYEHMWNIRCITFVSSSITFKIETSWTIVVTSIRCHRRPTASIKDTNVGVLGHTSDLGSDPVLLGTSNWLFLPNWKTAWEKHHFGRHFMNLYYLFMETQLTFTWIFWR